MDIQHMESFNTIIYKTNLLLKNHLQEYLNPFSLTTEQWALLRCLNEKDGVNQKHIALTLFKKQAVVTRILNAMEDQKLLERRSSKCDKREFLIYLTSQGRELYAQTLPAIAQYRVWLSSQIPETDMQNLSQILTKFNDTLIHQVKE